MLTVIGTLFMWGFLAACIAAGAWVIRRTSRGWSDPWRVAAYLTLAPAFIDAAMIAIGTTRDPTSHNLWPFELLMAGGGGAIALGVLALVHRITRGERALTALTRGASPPVRRR